MTCEVAPFAHAVGATDATGAPIWEEGDVHARYPIASVTKLLTALSVLIAVEEGKWSLEAPAGPPGSTVRHLLSHASGLSTTCPGNVPLGKDVAAPVGQRRIYSNQGYDLLTELFSAQVSPWKDWTCRRVLGPLGMQNTVLGPSGASGAVSSVWDLTLLGQELLDPQVLPRSVVKGLSSPAFAGLKGVLPGYGFQRDNLWGLGAEIRDHKHPHWTSAENSPQTFGHFGVAGSFLWVDRQAAVSAVFLGAEPFGPWHRANWPALNDAILRRASRLRQPTAEVAAP